MAQEGPMRPGRVFERPADAISFYSDLVQVIGIEREGLLQFYETILGPPLEQVYTLRERAEVMPFLERYPFLTSLLLEAYSKVKEYFPDSQAFLEIVGDPEETDDDQLVLFIATNSDPDEALERLDQFDENWWLDALDRAQGKLGISVEFV